MGQFMQLAVLVAATAIAISPVERSEAWISQREYDLEANSVSRSPEALVDTKSIFPNDLPPGATGNGSPKQIVFASLDGDVGDHEDESSSAVSIGPQNACAALGMDANPTASGLFERLSDVKNADECQGACANIMECGAAIFDIHDSTCELLTNLRLLVVNPTKAVVLPNCDSTCFEIGKKLSGTATSLGTAPNARICQAMCQAEAICGGFSWIQSTNACMSYMSYGSESDRLDDEDAISGPRQSCSPNTKPSDYSGNCVQDQAVTGKGTLYYSKGLTFQQCKEWCLQVPKCNWITYNSKHNDCHLKPGRGRLMYAMNGDLTCPKFTDSSCFQKDVQLNGDFIAQIEDSKFPHYCHYECSVHKDCSMWSWDEESKQCSLYSDPAEGVPSARLAKGFWTNIREACGDEAQYAEGAGPVILPGPENACAAVLMGAGTTAPFRQIVDVENVDECQEACRTFTNCKAAVFDVGTLTCDLLESLEQLVESEDKAVVLPICDSNCFVVGEKLSGVEAFLGTAPNPHMCQAMCQANASCEGFSWLSSSKACISYDNDSSFVANEDAVSGSRASCSPNIKSADYAGTCTLDGTGDAENYEVQESFTLKRCQHSCLADEECKWFSYNSVEMKCYKKKERGAFTKIREGDVSGPKFCDSSCFLKDIQLIGTTVSESWDSLNANHCHHACIANANCKIWSWDGNIQHCMMFGGSTDSSTRYTKGFWTGRREPCGQDALYVFPAEECAVRGVKYGGTHFDILNTINASHCQEMCRTSPNCQAFAFDIIWNRCHLLLAVAEQKKVNDSSFISGPKACGSCVSWHSEYISEPLREISSGVNTVEECQLRCQAEAKCTHWSYTASGSCKLMDSDGPTKYAFGSAFGMKYCVGTCDLEGFAVTSPAFGWAPQALEIGNVDECRAQCSSNTQCTTFMYLPETNKCHLKDGTALRHLVPQQGAITGFADCSKCLRQGIGYNVDAAALLWSLEARNAEECRVRCDLMENCTRFTYDAADRTCSLLSGETGDEQKDTLISGPVSCSAADTSCFQQDLAFLSSDDNVVQANAADAAACQELCARSIRCRFFSQSPDKVCFLITGANGQPTTEMNKSRWVSGNKKCVKPIEGCTETFYDYHKHDIYSTWISTRDPAECQQFCYNEPQCRIWLLNRDLQRCWLKRSESFNGRELQSNDVVSAGRLGCARCPRAGIAYSGPIIARSTLPSDAQCQLACEANDQCNYFSFLSGGCTLMSSMGTVNAAGSDTISGPKQC